MPEVLSVKLDKEKLDLLEAIAREERSDRSTVARKLLDMGMREWKIDRAVDLFVGRKVSLWKAADEAGVSLREFVDILNERKIVWVGVKPEELEEEAQAIMKESR